MEEKNKLHTAIASSLEALSDGVLLAYSGGLDSTVLLFLLQHECKLLDLRLEAIYVAHGIRPAEEQQEECLFVQQYCESLDLPLHVLHLSRLKEDAKESGRSLEDLARERRYNCFRVISQKTGLRHIFLAHHLDDQVETVLLQLFRSGSLRSMAAMQPISTFGDMILHRPLLNIMRAEILQYARAQSLNWQEDSTNKHERYLRNYLRHSLIPSIAKRFPGYKSSILRSSEEASDIIAEMDALPGLCKKTTRGVEIDRLAFDALSKTMRIHRLRQACEVLMSTPPVLYTVRLVQKSSTSLSELAAEQEQVAVSNYSRTAARQISRRTFLPLLENYNKQSSHSHYKGAVDSGGKNLLRTEEFNIDLYNNYLLCTRRKDIIISGYFFYLTCHNIQLSIQCTGYGVHFPCGDLTCKVPIVGGDAIVLRSPARGDRILIGDRSSPVSDMSGQFQNILPLIEDAEGVAAVLSPSGRVYYRSGTGKEDAVLHIQLDCVHT